MKESTIEIICCPLCKGELKLQIETKNNENIVKGSMACNNCTNKYLIRDGIPRMYKPDNEIITISDSSKFLKFIITPENLNKWIRRRKTPRYSDYFTNKMPTKFLLWFGWILLFFNISILILSYFNFKITNKIPSFVIYLFICAPVTFFIIEYLIYRMRAKIEYLTNLHTLKKLSDEKQLSEYDIRTFTRDREEDFKNAFENGKSFVATKGKKITSILNNYNFKGKKALNVGCGGSLHKLVSKPYFDKEYDMIGVDISEEYLKQFNQIFNTEVIQANSMALPFKKNSFDLINFTDLVEHLHHPLLGLSEAQRVLRVNGIIILTTNNHCAISFRCLNPLIFIEKIISLYYDKILPSRTILGQWLDFNFYHTEFSKNEIISLIKAAGFEILTFETQFPDLEKLSKLFKKFPLLRFMCNEFWIIGKKKQLKKATINFLN